MDCKWTLRKSGNHGFCALIAACLGLLMGICPADEDRWTVSFQGEGRGAGSTAVALPSAKGLLLVTVAAGGGDVSHSLVQLAGQQVPARIAGFDSVSRLCFFRPEESAGVRTPVWLMRAPVQPGAILTARAGKVEILGKTEGWVNQIGGKILPLALLRVGFGGTIPVPGTPLLDESGKVAAVTFQRGDDDDCVYALPAEAVHRVARDVVVSGKLNRGWLGVALRVEEDKPRIVRVFHGSPAAEVGIRENDLISKIGSRTVASYADVANAFFYIIPGEPIDVEVRRGQNLLAFTLVPSGERPGN